MSARNKNLAVNPPVFFISGGLLVAFLLIGVFATDWASELFPKILAAVTTNFGWLYVSAIAFFIVFALWLLFSRYGRIRLGDDDERPEFPTLAWASMLFSAGMGIGLVFYGVAEPMMHYANPPVGEGGSAASAARALPLTYFHWGIHAWAIYVLMALGIAYFAFRRKLPLALRSCFYPILGERIYGPIGHVIDILAVLGTLFGLATSLGLGAMQVSAGLHHLFEVPKSVEAQLVLIAVITAAATVSLLTGVSRGIRRLSELNMVLAGLLMVFVLIAGPTLYIIDSFVQNLGAYLGQIIDRTFVVGVHDDDEASWLGSWTLFYWGWWIAWSPFVGMFVARISRGRTIRELVAGALLVPTGIAFLWFSVFGGTALHLEQSGAADVANAVGDNVDTAIYVVLSELPFGAITSFLAATVVAVFFVTSSDSASFVVDMLTSGGHPDPPRWQRVFWATTEGATAATLLYAGAQYGGDGEAGEALEALQAGVISIGLPFCIVLIFVCINLAKALRADPACR